MLHNDLSFNSLGSNERKRFKVSSKITQPSGPSLLAHRIFYNSNSSE